MLAAGGRGPLVAQDRAERGSLAATVFAGLGLGAAGFLSGALVAAETAEGCREDYCQLEAAFYGAAAGGTFGLSVGTHLGNGRRGNFPVGFLAAAGIWTLGVVPALSGESDTYLHFAFVAVPITQVIATVVIERETGARRSAASRAFVLPTRRGLTLGASLPF